MPFANLSKINLAKISEIDLNGDMLNDKMLGIVAHKAPLLTLDVLLCGKSWEQAFADDWRKKKAWQPGWEYVFDKYKLFHVK